MKTTPLCCDRSRGVLYEPATSENMFVPASVQKFGECIKRRLFTPVCVRCPKYSNCDKELRLKGENELLTNLGNLEAHLEERLITVREMKIAVIKQTVVSLRQLNIL